VTAGALTLTHVVLVVAGVMVQGTPNLREAEAGIQRSYVEGDMTRIFAGGYLEVIAFMCLMPAVIFLGRAVGTRSEGARWAAQSGAAFGVAYVALSVGTGFAPGAAALWGAQNGLDPTTALAVNNVRNFAYYLGLVVLGAQALCVGAAALADRWSPRVVGCGGVLVGALLLVSVPFAGYNAVDPASVMWLVWWCALGVQLLRHRPEVDEDLATGMTVRHHEVQR
jgi:hypothetical protein